MFGVVFFLGSRKMVSGGMRDGRFVALQLYLGRMIWPLIAIGWVINLVQRCMASMVRLDEVLRVEVPLSPRERVGEAGVRGDIEIRNLTYAYDSHPVLRDISLNIRHGETVGIVGPTGNGKSALLWLITRTCEPAPRRTF